MLTVDQLHWLLEGTDIGVVQRHPKRLYGACPERAPLYGLVAARCSPVTYWAETDRRTESASACDGCAGHELKPDEDEDGFPNVPTGRPARATAAP